MDIFFSRGETEALGPEGVAGGATAAVWSRRPRACSEGGIVRDPACAPPQGLGRLSRGPTECASGERNVLFIIIKDINDIN